METNGSSSESNLTNVVQPPRLGLIGLCTFESVVGIPVAIAIMGTVLNIVSFVVFMRPALRSVVTTFYYRVLVVTDTVTLSVAVWPLLAKFHLTCVQNANGSVVCRVFYYLMNVSMDTNAWALMIVHVQTYRSVAHPHLTRVHWTMKTAIYSVMACLFTAFLFNLPIFFLQTNHIAWESVKFVAYSVFPLVVTLIHNIKTNSLLKRSSNTEKVGCCRLTSMATVIMTLCITNSGFTLPYSLFRLITSIDTDPVVVLPGYLSGDCVLMVAYFILLLGCSIKFMVFRCICFRFSGQCNRLFGCHDTLFLPAGADKCKRDLSTRSSVRIESMIYTGSTKKHTTPKQNQNK